MTTAAEVRTMARARLVRAQEVRRRFEAFQQDIENGRAVDLASVTVRCDEPGHRGKMPKLAEFVISQHGALFTSRIAYLPSDQLNLRPWTRQHLLGAGGESLLEVEDQVIDNFILHLDEWEAGQTPTGERWLKSAPPTEILEVLDLPPIESRLALWTRCKDHPAKAEALSPSDLFASARRV